MSSTLPPSNHPLFSSQENQDRSRTRVWGRSLIFWGAFFAALSFTSQEVALGLSLHALGYAQSLLGSHLSAMALGAMLFAVPSALLIGRTSLSLLLSRSLLILCFLWLARAWITTETIRLGFSFAAGGCLALYSVGASILLLEFTPKSEQPHAFSRFASAGLLGAFLGSFLAGSTPDFLHHWMNSDLSFRTTLSLSALTVLITSLLFFQLSRSFPHSRPPIEKKIRWLELDRPDLRKRFKTIFSVISPHFVVALGAAATVGFLPVYLAERFHYSAFEVGIVFSIAQLATWLGVQACPSLMRRFGNAGSLVVLQGGSIPFLIAIAFAPWAWIASIAVVARAALMNMTGPPLGLYHFENCAPQDQKFISSCDVVLWNLAWGTIPQISGILISRVGYTPSLLWTAFCYSLATLMYWRRSRFAARIA